MRKAIWAIGMAMAFWLPQLAFGQTPPNTPCDNLLPSLDPGCLPINSQTAFFGLLFRVLSIFRTIFWILSIAMLMWAAYKFLASRGNDEMIKSGRRTLTFAIVAMIVALIATSLPFLIRAFLGY